MKTYSLIAHRGSAKFCPTSRWSGPKRPLWKQELQAENVMDALIQVYQEHIDREEFVSSEASAERNHAELYFEAITIFINLKEA